MRQFSLKIETLSASLKHKESELQESVSTIQQLTNRVHELEQNTNAKDNKNDNDNNNDSKDKKK